MKELKKTVALFLAIVLVVSGLTGCSGADKNSALLEGDLTKKTVMKVNDAEITMDTIMYYILEQEAQYSYDDTYYMAAYGTSYWDMELDDEATTVRDKLQEYVLEVAQLYEIFYQEAEKAGYELTQEDIEEAEVNAYSIWETMSEHQKKVTNLTEESLIEIFKKISLATKYYDEVYEGLEIDEEAVTSGINQKDYQEYSIEAMVLENYEEDSEGYLTDIPKKEYKAGKKRIKKYLKQYEPGTSFQELLPETEEKIYVDTLVFSKGDKQLSEELEAAAMELENDECTGILETKDVAIVIRMVDNASTDSYEQAVATALEEAETAVFDAAYAKIKEAYTVEMKMNIWDQLEMGKLTIDDEAEEPVEAPDTSVEE